MQTASAFSSVQDALSFFITAYRTLAEWQAVVARLDGFEAAIDEAARAAQPRRQDSASSPTPGSDAIDLDDLTRHAAGRTRRWSSADGFQLPRQRAHADHRPVRLRQVDAVPRHRRDLAVRLRRDRRSGRRHADDAAAAAVFSGRLAAAPRSSIRRRPRRFTAAQIGRGDRRRSACRRWRRGSTRTRTGTGCCRSASSSGSALARALLHAPQYLFLDEATASLDEPSEAALYRLLGREAAGHHHRLDRPSLDAGRLPRPRCVTLTRAGDRFTLQDKIRTAAPAES